MIEREADGRAWKDEGLGKGGRRREGEKDGRRNESYAEINELLDYFNEDLDPVRHLSEIGVDPLTHLFKHPLISAPILHICRSSLLQIPKANSPSSSLRSQANEIKIYPPPIFHLFFISRIPFYENRRLVRGERSIEEDKSERRSPKEDGVRRRMCGGGEKMADHERMRGKVEW